MSRILVVEDSSSLRECLAHLLGREGYEVSLACNGKDGWMTLYSEPPELIVLDLMMPEMDGLTFLRQLRSHHHWNTIPVLVLTGQAADGVQVRKAKELGVTDVLLKGSVEAGNLIDRIQSLVPVRKTAQIAVA